MTPLAATIWSAIVSATVSYLFYRIKLSGERKNKLYDGGFSEIDELLSDLSEISILYWQNKYTDKHIDELTITAKFHDLQSFVSYLEPIR
jgi:hypothetical protein